MSSDTILLDVKWEQEGRLAAFEEAFPDRTLLEASETESVPDPAAVRYAVVWHPKPGFLATLPKLEVLFSLGAGVDHVVSDPDLPDVPLVRFVDPDLTGRMVEWVVLQVLMHTRRQRAYDALQRKRQWKELNAPPAHDLRIGIMGFGELGQACAKVLAALGYPINAWSRTPKDHEGITSFAGNGTLDAFLAQTDILVALLPHTPETHGILNARLIDGLAKDGPLGAPVLINAGRGGSQVESDIVAALEDGRLAGVSLDVFETEPLAAASPLWNFNNAILTPHMAAVSDPKALADHVARQIARHEAGEPLEHLVDRERGY